MMSEWMRLMLALSPAIGIVVATIVFEAIDKRDRERNFIIRRIRFGYAERN